MLDLFVPLWLAAAPAGAVELDITNRDALAVLVDRLFMDHDLPISLEVVPLAWPGDLEGGQPRVGRLMLSFDALEPPAAIARRAVEQWETAGLPIDFDVVEDVAGVHIVPVRVKDVAGSWRPVKAPFDTEVDLPSHATSFDNAMGEVLEAVRNGSGAPIAVGMVPFNLNDTVIMPSGKMSARAFVADLVHQLSEARRGTEVVSWRMAWSYTQDTYVFNFGLKTLDDPWERPSGFRAVYD